MLFKKNFQSPLLFLALLFLAISPLLAANEAEQNFKSARQAYEEGIFEIADQRFAAFLKNHPESKRIDEARLLDAKSLYYLGRYQAALNLLGSSPAGTDVQAETLLWQGKNLLSLQKWSEAEAKYRELENQFPKSDQAISSQLDLAWTLFKQNREKEASDLLTQLGVDRVNTELGQKALLILAKFEISGNQFPNAQAKLEAILGQHPKPEIFFEASYWLGELYSADHQFSKAVTQYLSITTNKKAFPKPIVGQAWYGLAKAYFALNQFEEAMTSFEQSYLLNDLDEVKLSSFKNYLESARLLKRLPEATAKLIDFSKKNGGSSLSPSILFAIAEAQKNDKDFDKAASSYEGLLSSYPQSEWTTSARFELGKIDQQLGKTDMAIKAFEACVTDKEDPALAASAEFELGKIYFDQKLYDKAQDQFAQLFSGKSSFAEEAGYNLLLVQVGQNQIDSFLKTQEQFSNRFPQSSYNNSVTFLRGNLQEKLGQYDQAKVTYEKALLSATTASQKAILNLRLADLACQAGKLDEASQLYEKYLKDFPDSADFPNAALKGIMTDLAVKKITDDQAVAALDSLLKKYPQHERAPQILFDAAEIYYNRQDYVNAEIKFAQLAQQYPKDLLVDNANYWAGISAAAHGDEAGAIPFLEKVPDQSPFKIDARLVEVKIYYHQLKFENALTLLESILASEKMDAHFVEAMMLKGNCYFALGEKEGSNYELAAAAYGAIINGKQGNLSERNEAGYRRAKCLEKLGRAGDALALYLDVFYGRLASSTENETSPSESLWKIKSGLEAGRMKEETKDWRGAIQVYQNLQQLGGGNEQEFQEVINRIRREHYLYE